MAAAANRRKLTEATVTLAAQASSISVHDSENSASFDRLTFFVNLTAVTGSVTLAIQTTPDDGANWYPLAVAEMSGDTGALAATGKYHVSSNGPIGTRTRLFFTMITGPYSCTIIPVYEKGGSVY